MTRRKKPCSIGEYLERFSTAGTHGSGRTSAFTLALGVIVVWDTWEPVIDF